jgi:hypothetical protein
MKTNSPGLSHWTPHHTILHLFVIPSADYAAKITPEDGQGTPETFRVAEFLE